MALKLRGTKLFPDRQQLIKLGKDNRIDKPEVILQEYAETICDYVNNSAEINALEGLKDSILRSVHTATSKRYLTKNYVHHKKKKYE